MMPRLRSMSHMQEMRVHHQAIRRTDQQPEDQPETPVTPPTPGTSAASKSRTRLQTQPFLPDLRTSL